MSGLLELILVNILYSNETSFNFQTLFQVIVSACPQLTALTVDVTLKSNDATNARLDFAAMEPAITRLPLTFLSITHTLPLRLSHEDIIKITQILGPRIMRLYLNDSPSREVPVSENEVPLTLAVLIPYAQYCRKLQRLGLYVDTTIAVEPPPTGAEFSSTLHSTYFGRSPIEDPRKVFEFLDKIGCRDLVRDDEMPLNADHERIWTRVGEMFGKASGEE